MKGSFDSFDVTQDEFAQDLRYTIRMKLLTFFNRWFPPLLMMMVIFWWSSRSDLPGSPASLVWWDVVIKKMAHLIEYGLLFFSFQRALNWEKSVDDKSYRIAFLLTLLYAFSDEMHQSFTPGRHPKLVDVSIDSIGALLTYLKLTSLS